MRKLSTPQLIAGKEVKHWSFKTGLTLFMVMLTTLAFSQINYTRSTFTGAYTPITVGGGATQISTVGTGLGDFTTTTGVASGTDGSAHILLPFDFVYNGVGFATGIDYIGINANGYVYPIAAASGGTNAGKIISSVNTNLFTNAAPNNTIAPYWDDLTIGTAINGNTGTVLYQVSGSAGSQVLTIQYTNVPAFSSGSVKALNFQVKIYETTNVIEFVYGPMTNGTATGAYSVSETASIGIEGSAGGNTNYIDAITGSKTANMSMMNSNKFTSLLNIRFTPGAPSAVAGGTYNVGVGQTYPSLSEAVADLNHRGIAGAVTLNLTDAVYDSTAAGGKNIFPIVVSNIAGTSAVNTILIDHIGSHADLRYRGTDQGNIGNQAGTATIGTTFEPMFCLVGTDWLTVNNLDFTYNGVQGTAVSYQTTNGKVDNSIGVINSSATDGATNNTFSNFVCTGDRTCTGGGQAIRHFTQTTPTNATGANSNNTYRDFVIKNGTSGLLISGTAAFPDINNRVITSSCNTYNLIGDAAIVNDMQNSTVFTTPFGITMTNQSGFTVSNNKITNISNTNASSNSVLGINVSLFQGANNTVSNNIITNLRQNTPSTTTSLNIGLQITNATTGTNNIRVYNNSISGITTAFNGAATATRVILGISCASTANTTSTYEIYNNSISIDGSGSLTGSNSCFQVAGTTGPKYDVRNNIFANYTAAQVGLNVRHNCYNTNSSTLLGGTGTTVNQNDMYIANDAGVSGFIGWNTASNVGFNPVGTFNTTFATQVTAPNISGDPLFFNNNGNLHATNSALLAGAGSVIPAYITTDLDCNPRTAPNHIGAYLAAPCLSAIPTVTVSPAGPSCTLTPLTATTSAVNPVYQWIFNGNEIFGATTANYTPGVAGNGTYTCRVNELGENCFGVSNAVVVNLSPTITVTPTSASVCDGQTVNINTAITNLPLPTYSVSAIPSAPIAVPGSGITTYTNNAGGGAPLIALSNGTLDDGRWDNIALPFSVNYYGAPFSVISITTNGGVQFGSQAANLSNTGYSTVIPGVGVPNNHYYGFNMDQDWRNIGIIRTWVDGVTPNRTFVIDYNGGQFFSGVGSVSYQLHIKENGSLETHITTTTGSANAGAIGVENSTGTAAVAAPGRNTIAANAIVAPESWRFAPVPPPTYDYAWSPAADLSSTSVANPVATPFLNTTTVYTVVVTSASNGCTVSATTSITNLGVADAQPTTIGDNACANEVAHLEASGVSTLNWYTAATGGTLAHTGTSWDSTWTATTTYYVESFNGNCPSPRTPVTVNVTSLPVTVPSATPANICFGGTSQLDAGTFLSGTLSTPFNQNNGSSATGFDIENISASPVTLHFFSFQSNTIAGTVGIQSVYYNPTPMNCTFPANVTTAPGWILIGSVSTTSAGNTLGVPTVIPLDVNITIPAGAKYAFAVGGALGQAYTTGVTLCPTPFILGTTPHLRVFQGFGGTLTGTIANRAWNGTVTYQFGDPNLNFVWAPAGDLDNATIKTPIATPSTPGLNPYTVTVTNAGGCTSTATVTVNALALPVAPSAVVNSVPCGNGAASLTATGSGGTLKWFANASGGAALSTGANFSPVVSSDTIFYVSEFTLATPFCEGPRTAVPVNIVEPDTIAATVDIPLICDQSPGAIQVALSVANVSSPQTNQYFYTWTAPGTGGLNTSTGAAVTANPTVTTIYTVTANQIGNLTVNINGASSLDATTTQDSIAWTLRDASNAVVLSSPVYSGINNNVTSGPVLSNNGPYTFQIYTSPTDTGFANFYIMCDGDTISSGCIKGAADTQQVSCLNTDTVTVNGLSGCFSDCNRVATVRVGVGVTPTFSSLTATQSTICEGGSTIITAAASSTGGSPVAEFGVYCAPVIYTSPGATSDNITNVSFNTLNNTTGDGPGDYNYYTPGPGTTTTVNAGSTYSLSVSVNTAFGQAKAVFIDWNNNGSFADVGELVLTGASSTAPATGNITVPFSAVNGAVRMRVTCVFGGTPGATYACSPNSFGFGEVEDYTISVIGGTPSTFTWSPSAGLSATSGSSVTFTPSAIGTYTYTATASDPGGCTSTSAIVIQVNDIPDAPVVTGDVVCGPDTVNLSATLSDLGNTIIWTDTIGGQILASGTNYDPYVTTSGSYYVHEVPPTTATTMNNNIGASAGFFPDGASFMNFTVTAPGGIIINTVDVSTNAPVANVPLVVALVNQTTGQIVSVHDTIFLTAGGNTALQTISLNMYVPAGNWRLQPILNPNLNVSNSSTLPSSINGQITVTCFGNVSNACFPTNFNGLFYNWNVSTACISPAAIVNYVVNPSPGLGIASSNGLSFCDSVNTVLSAVDSTLSGYDVFEWSPATGLSATTGSSVAVANLYATTTYTLTAQNSVSGCNAIATFTANVNPSPSLSLSYHDTTYCPVAVPALPFNSTAAKSSIVPVGNRFDPNFVVGTVFGGNTTQRSQMIFTAAELNAAGLVGPTNITSIAYFVSNKLTTTTYLVDISMRADVSIPTAFGSTNHITTLLTPVYNNPAITSNLGWNTFVFSTPFLWDGVSNILVDQCFTHNTPGFFDVVATSPTAAVRYNALNASACNATIGAFIPAPNQNDRPNVRFTGGNVLFSWSPALGLSSTTVEDPSVIAALIGNNDTTITYSLTVTDPLSGCSKTDSITVNLSTTPLDPIVHYFSDSIFCFTGDAKMYVSGTTGDFQWQSSSDGINFTDIPGAINDTLIQTILTTTYYRVDVSCSGDSINSEILKFEVKSPGVAAVVGDTICGVGEVCLSAERTNSLHFIQWFNDSTGGNVIALGDTLCTVISATDTFWVQSTVDPNSQSQSGTIFYMRGSAGEPWGSTTNVAALNAVYGPQGTDWNLVTYPTAIPANIFNSSTKIVFMEGSDASITEFSTFYTANLTLIQNWVSAGGHLFVNAGPNGGPGTVALGFGGVTLNNSVFTATATISAGQSGHPIFNTPLTGLGSSWTGGSYGHATITGGSATALLDGLGAPVLSVLDFGNGRVLFGGMTMTNFHAPLPQADNLRRNMFSFMNTGFTACNSAPRIPVVAVSTTPPAMALLPVSTAICELTCVNLDVDAAGQANYPSFEWSPATGLSASTGASVVACPTVTTTYVVTGSDLNGCANADTVVITVTPAPIISNISVGTNPICVGDSAEISLTVIPFIPPTGNYTVSAIPFAPVIPTGTPTLLSDAGVAIQPLASGSLDDGTWTVPLPAGFAFNYFGVTPTTFDVSTNGFIGFGGLGGLNGCCSGQVLPNAGTPNNVVAMAWEDWNHTAGTMDVFVNGVAPFRKVVIRAQGIPRFGATGAPTTAMIVLNETFNTIEMHLTSVTAGAADNTTQGIEDGTGALATVVTGRNSTPWTATNEGWLFAPPVNSSISYAWSPATGLSSTTSGNPKASPLVSTQYTVTATETGTGCSRVDSVVVVVTPNPKPILTPGDTILCSNDLAFDMTVVDTGAYAGGYPPGTTFDFYGAGAVLYQSSTSNIFLNQQQSDAFYAVVTLPNFLGGCVGTSDTSVVDFGSTQAPQYTLGTDSVGCFGASTGNAIATITFGGTPDFRYQWYTSNFGTLLRDVTTSNTVDTLSGQPTGWYIVRITDHQGFPTSPYCSVVDSIFLGEPQGPIEVFEEVNGHVDVQCYGYATGAIDVTASGGTGSLSYLWSNGSTDEDQSGLVAGVYTVTVTDQRGCFYEFVTEIVENPQVTVGTDQSNVSCNSGSDGSATVYVNGGVGGYSYLWSNGTTDQTAFDLAAGTYTVVITDNSGNPGCDTIITFLITEPTLLDATSSVNNLNCHGASNGVATVYPIGGNPPYSYSWNSIPVQTTATAVNLTAGTYTCMITDSTGCAKDVVVQISEPDSIIVDQLLDNPSCFGANDGNAIVTVSGGTPGYSYLWSNGETTNTATGLSAGTYIVTVTDANGCQVISSVLMVEPTQIQTTIGCLTNVSCNGQATGTACVMPSGGTPGYTYLWNTVPAQTTSSASGLAAGTYTVVVTDANGCTVAVDVTITQPDAIALNAAVEDPLCNGGPGSVELSITGGAQPYSILWSNGATTEINGGLLAGTYSVTVTDANGCIVNQSFVISNPTAISATAAVSNVTCNGGVNGSITMNVSGGAGGYSYQWSNGEITSTIVGLVAGNYTVTITDLNSCSITQTVVVTQPAELSCICNANVTNVSCFGLANGSITALPIGGTAPYSYSWIRVSPSVSGVLATTQTISGLTAGTYQVTITDANGCVKVGNATVTEPTQLIAFGIVNGNVCSGSSNGSITVNTYGGIPPYSYAWSTIPVQTSSTATGLGAGSYSCVVTDANGCSVTVNNTISTPNAIVLSTSSTNARCFGAKNGTASVTASGGVAPFTYLWSNGKTTSLAIGLPAGTYTVTVTDSYGCTAIASVVVGQPAKLAALYVTSNPSCFGTSNGTINLTVTGGLAPYTYTWSNGSTNEDQSGLTAGLYTVLVKDKNGCVINSAVTLTQPNAISLSTNVKDLKCFGASNGKVTVNVTGGTAPYAYAWSTGSTIVSTNNLTAGTYTVTVTDSKGCSNSISATVTQPAQLICNATVINNVSCFGGSNGKISVSASGGLSPYKYLWNTNPVATTKIVNNVPAGTYSVTVKDKNGCTSVCTVTVTQPLTGVTATVSGTNIDCFGANNGTASVIGNGGTAPYTYLWNTSVAATTDNISGLAAGIYTVTVTDVNGCTGTGSVTITQNPALSLTETHMNASCGNINFGSLGSITATATGGLSPYTYTLNPGAISNSTGSFTNLNAGTYDVTVTDAAGCSATINGIVISQPAPLVMGTTSSTDVACFGGNNGTAAAGAVSGGIAPYTYSWNTVPPQVTSTAIGLTAGTYTVTVTDAGGCTVSGIAVINEPASAVTIQVVNQSNISCNGGATGSAEVLANGGTGPYSYLWSDGQTTTIATGLTAGAYQVTATDANGCVATTSVVITQPNQFIVTASFTNVLCNGNLDGTITASVSGGNAPFSYTLNPGNLSSGTGLFTGLGAGIYTVEATDGGGCTASVMVTITEPGVLVANTNSTDVSCNAGSNGTATVYATGGTAPYTYTWTGGSSLQNPTGLTAGTYTVTVTDANNCSLERTVTISEPAAISIAQSQTNVLCSGLTTGTATATVTGGSAPYFYFWSNGQLTATATGLSAGIYTVTVSDYKGCSVTATYDITETTTISVDTNVTNPTCFGGLGTAEVIPTGGTPVYTYEWSNGATTSVVSVTAGTYYVTITDANGCNVTQCVVVTEPSQVICAATATDVTCNGLNDGTATANASGGVALAIGNLTVGINSTGNFADELSYQLLDAGNVPVLSGGPFAFGEVSTSAPVAAVNGPYTLNMEAFGFFNDNFTNWTVYCNGNPIASGCLEGTVYGQLLCLNSGSISIPNLSCSVPGAYSYLWSNGQTTQTATGLAPGTYSVTVTDNNGCSSICSVTVNEPAALSLGLSTSNATCGTSNGSATATVSGGTAPYSYLWSTTETSQSVSNLAPGTYTVTVTDANGCGPVSASVTIGTNVPVSCTTTQVNPTCSGYSNGSATVIPAGGNGSYTVLWNTAPVQNTLTATGLAAGTYEVTVTDISGCSSVCTVEITEPSPLVLSATQTNSACNGGNSGIAIVTANGGTPFTVGSPYSYLWTNGQTTATATGLASGTYYVTVKDSVGCEATLCVIMQQPIAVSCNTSTTPTVCGQAIGSAVVNVFGGSAPYSYNWSTVPAQTNAIATLLAAGTYTVVVTDANGCTTQCTATVIQPGAVSFSLGVVNASCNGGNGMLSVNGLNGGTAPYTYLWSNASTTSSITAVAGSYTVTVTDANGCSMFANGTISEPAVLVATGSSVDVSCNGNTNGSACISVSGGTQPYSYSWNTGASSVCINNLFAGTYTATVTDSKGCTQSIAVTISQPNILDTLSTAATVASCGLNNGTGTVIPTGGTAPYTYSWNTNPVQTTQTATGLAGGNNFVTVTDAKGCAITVCIKVPTSNGIGLALNSPTYAGGVNIRCNGGTDGSINLTVSGTGPFTYNWSNGATTEDIFGLTAGLYSVTVSNGGCTSTASITLTQGSVIVLSTSQVNVTCQGGITGSATVNVVGGTAPYNYNWSTTPVQTNKTATGLSAGAYTVTVGDANGCTQTVSVTLTQPATGMNITASSVNPNCNGASNGSIDITVNGGTAPYSYLWTDGAITEDRTGMNAGSHTVTVTDASGCTIQLCVVLTQPTQISLTTSKTDVSCAGGNSGSANVAAAGGTPPYTYLWNNGATTASISGLFAGTFTVTVTDANGCIRYGNVVINASAPMTLATQSTNVTVYGGNNGTASVTVMSGGTAPYSYSWNTIAVKTTASVTGLTAGTYQVTVVDNLGCVKTASVVITQPNYICSTGTPFRTETPSRWGAATGTAATYLTANFSAAFPGGLVVGGGCVGSKTLSLTNATAVRNYEVNQSVSGSGTVLSANLLNPTSAAFQSALAANCVALTLNVTFDAYDPNFAPLPTVNLGSLIYNAAPFAGLTVNQILSEGNRKLGGCSSPYTISQLNTAMHNIDSAYKAGVTGPTASLLSCPAPPRLASSTSLENDVTVYPNPSIGVLNVKFEAAENGNIVINMMDMTGRSVWNIQEPVFVGENVRTYDFSQLPKGIYLMQVIKEGKSEIIKVVLR